MSEQMQKIFILIGVGCIAFGLRNQLLGLVNFIFKIFSTPTAKKRAKMQRRVAESGPVRVRQTDIVQNMTNQDKQKYVQAEALNKEGKYKEAAVIFESIKFQRKAIDVLEMHGLLDEAAEVLMRLNVPQRAAAVYERHKAFGKAADYYLLAKQYDKAAQLFLGLAKKDHRYLIKAGKAYEQTGNKEGMLKVWSKSLETDKIIYYCMKNNEIDLLADYMRDPIVATQFFKSAEDPQLQTFFAALELTPQMAQAAMSWCWVFPKGHVIVKILSWLRGDKELAKGFLKSAPKELLSHIVETFKKHGAHMSHDLVKEYIEYFIQLEQSNAALEMSIAHGSIRLACQILAERNDISAVKDLITKSGSQEHIAKITAVLKDHPSPPWPGSIMKDVKAVIETLPTQLDTGKALNEKEVPKAIVINALKAS